MRKSKKIKLLEADNRFLKSENNQLEKEQNFCLKHVRYELENYCERCPCIKPKTEIVRLRDDRGNITFWNVHVTCEYAKRCAWLHGQLKKGNEQ